MDVHARAARDPHGEQFFEVPNNLTAIQAFVTRDNINGLLARSGLDEDLGIYRHRWQQYYEL